MNQDLLLSVAAAFAGFLLKTTLAFGLCLALNRLVDSANRRFILWLVFLCGVAAYWLFLANGILAGPGELASTPPVSFQAVSSTAGAWQIPGTWALPLGFVLRAIGIIYLLILFYMTVTHIRKRRHLKWVLGFTSEPPVELAETFRSLAQSLHVSRSRLLVLSGATSPATFGWIRPKILLPTLCLEQDRSELEDILRHELHHVRRWDSVWNGIAIACRALLFFHPAAWYAVRKIQFDRELACDFAVISHSPTRRGKYAECLIRFARLNLAQDSKAWGLDFAASAEHLTVRVHSILAVSKKAPGWLLCLRTASALTLSALFLSVVPSLAILLTYAHRPTTEPSAAMIRPSPTGTPSEAKVKGKLRSASFPAQRVKDAWPTSSNQSVAPQPAMDLPTDRKTEDPSTRQSNTGPQLLRRSAASGLSSGPNGNDAKSQTVALVDPDASAQVGKDGSRNAKQVLQQSATAAIAIYKRAAALDRH